MDSLGWSKNVTQVVERTEERNTIRKIYFGRPGGRRTEAKWWKRWLKGM